MNAWLRLLGFLFLVALAALALKEMPPLLFVAGSVGGGTYVWWRLRKGAKDETEGGGVTALGLKRAEGDPFGISTLPLTLLSRGTDRVVENVVWGPWHHRELRAFEFRYSPGPGLDESRFLCALVGIDANCPPLVIEPVTFLTLPAERAGLREIGSGEEAFDRTFSVRGDEAFARALLDDRLRGWMKGRGEGHAFEIIGRLVACYSKRGANDLMSLLLALAGFLDRLPEEALGVGATSPPASSERTDTD